MKRRYIEGTTFNDIVSLYKLDVNLRSLFLKKDLNSALKAFHNASPSTSMNTLFLSMCFPKNWSSISRYSK